MNKMEDESDSDSSADEIENQRLKEAALSAETIVRETKRKETRNQENGLLPSQRSSSPVPDHNPLNTTPEFRTFVAKKLSELLDRSLKDKDEEIKKNDKTEQDTGIKLFSASTTLIRQVNEETPVPITSSAKQRPPIVKKRKLDSSSDSSDEESKLADAAISVDQIMKESQSPYIKTHNKKEKTILIVKEEKPAKKKKKKHKKKKDEIKVS
ncbi:protein CUSTOS-like [Saccostrea cucullata]|uniref:protein CUSTOS-like n=1 Tax=Saccostrea cuccullata TaxID=36930 RepID=UPI002ED3C142